MRSGPLPLLDAQVGSTSSVAPTSVPVVAGPVMAVTPSVAVQLSVWPEAAPHETSAG